MKEDSMTLPEGRAIFEFLEASGGVASVEDVSAHLTDAGLRPFHYRSIRRTTLFYREVVKREMLEESIMPTPEVTGKLVELIGYATTDDWVALRLNWYSQWRSERIERDRLDKARFERLLGYLWVPEFCVIKPYLLREDGKLHAVELGERPFKWLEVDTKGRDEIGVVRCWFNDEEDQWLRRVIATSANEADKKRIIVSYESVQREVSAYFWAAARQRTVEELGADLTVQEVLSNFRGGSTSTSHPRFAELLGLALDPQDLQGSVISFRDEVRFVVGL